MTVVMDPSRFSMRRDRTVSPSARNYALHKSKKDRRSVRCDYWVEGVVRHYSEWLHPEESGRTYVGRRFNDRWNVLKYFNLKKDTPEKPKLSIDLFTYLKDNRIRPSRIMLKTNGQF